MSEDADSLSQQPPAPEPPPKSFRQKAWNYIKSRFDADNWFGSIVTPLLGYVHYETIMSARTRLVNGIPDPDRKREISGAAQFTEKIWAFFSDRGGQFPEGDTTWKRMWNALKHPQSSAKQFEWLILLPTNILSNYGHIMSGLKAHGIGLKPGETAYTPEKIRLYSGLYQAMSTATIGFGHFKKRKDTTPQNTVLMQNKRNIFAIIREIWRHDRSLLIGIIMNSFSPLFAGVEGWTKSKKSHAEATHLARQSIANSVITSAYSVYTLQRIVKSNYRDAHAGTPPEIQQYMVEEEEEKKPSAEQRKQNTFVEKLAAQMQIPPIINK